MDTELHGSLVDTELDGIFNVTDNLCRWNDTKICVYGMTRKFYRHGTTGNVTMTRIICVHGITRKFGEHGITRKFCVDGITRNFH